MTHPVFASLLPVILIIGMGFAAGRLRWVGQAAVKDLSNLVFLLFTPALLFRTMHKVHPEQLDFTPVAAYFIGVGLLFAATLLVCGFNRRAAVLALAGTFSNTVMIGIPVVGLAFGDPGLVVLFTLYTVHTVLLLTSATVVLELAVAHEAAADGSAPRQPMWRTVLAALRNAVLHPVPLPIVAGLLFAQTGLVLPDVIDKPLQMMGQAMGPMALLLVGLTLAYTPLAQHARGAVLLAGVKNLLLPALVALAGCLLGLRGVPLAVIVVTSALPVGANVFMFSQRYRVAEDLVTASVAVSTVLALATVPLVLWLVQLM